ncbi:MULTISPECIES: hypothetical protein [Enterobacteriaceae]|uniref:hypothetical protein n=1 Tax=Enterobacteriaceae TaxID=543 RepID=UPI0013FD4C73|nr:MULTISPECIES: hypothetical protein [Klebsiella]MCT1424015.1 hypothetical protein [Klebsiella aerogenes]MCT1501899.1 hypothetical protein [Klebsiella aerogenes]MCT1794510.1 hypothetical protein [Klebsiella aerogenes]MCT2311670.1 hypothetical protein [Klebsiella aerogenes]MCT2319544.1 hypothetical protein [Klebsiella aerogenes]
MFKNNTGVYNYKNTDLKPNSTNSYRDKLRQHCVSVRLNKEELQLLNVKRGDIRKGEWLRKTFLNTTPILIPPINLDAWKELGKISQNLNKLNIHLDNKSDGSCLTYTELFAVRRQISELRLHLINIDLWRISDEGNAED